MKILKKNLFFFILFSAVISTCGIEEYYYLPQVPQENITTILNTNVIVNIPPVSSSFYYARTYSIYYKIYISNFDGGTVNEVSLINPTLASDFNGLSGVTNPAETSIIASSTTFSGRSYYKLDLNNIDTILSINGGTLEISFTGDTARANYSRDSIYIQNEILLRSADLTTARPDRYLRNTSDLRNTTFTANDNKDVNVGGNSLFAYVSMYLAAEGQNPVNFAFLISKPTHLGVFKLPDIN